MKDQTRDKNSARPTGTDNLSITGTTPASVGKLAANRLLGDSEESRAIESQSGKSNYRSRFEVLRNELPDEVRDLPVMLEDGSIYPKSIVDPRRLNLAGLGGGKYPRLVRRMAAAMYHDLEISDYQFESKTRAAFIAEAAGVRERLYQEVDSQTQRVRTFFDNIVECNAVIRGTASDLSLPSLVFRYSGEAKIPLAVDVLVDGPEKATDPMKFENFPSSFRPEEYRLVEERLKDFAHDLSINLASSIYAGFERCVEHNVFGVVEHNEDYQIAKFHYFELCMSEFHGHEIVRHEHSLHNAKLLSFDAALEEGVIVPLAFEKTAELIPGLKDEVRVLTGILTDKNDQVVYTGDPCICVGHFALVGWTTEEASENFHRRLSVRRAVAEEKTLLTWGARQFGLVGLHLLKTLLVFSRILVTASLAVSLLIAVMVSIVMAVPVEDPTGFGVKVLMVTWALFVAILVGKCGLERLSAFLGFDMSTLLLTEAECRSWGLGKGQNNGSR